MPKLDFQLLSHEEIKDRYRYHFGKEAITCKEVQKQGVIQNPKEDIKEDRDEDGLTAEKEPLSVAIKQNTHDIEKQDFIAKTLGTGYKNVTNNGLYSSSIN